MEFPQTIKGWGNKGAKKWSVRIKTGWEPYILIVNLKKGILSVRDGNHRYRGFS